MDSDKMLLRKLALKLIERVPYNIGFIALMNERIVVARFDITDLINFDKMNLASRLNNHFTSQRQINR